MLSSAASSLGTGIERAEDGGVADAGTCVVDRVSEHRDAQNIREEDNSWRLSEHILPARVEVDGLRPFPCVRFASLTVACMPDDDFHDLRSLALSASAMRAMTPCRFRKDFAV
jgi:hypothetical protein